MERGESEERVLNLVKILSLGKGSRWCVDSHGNEIEHMTKFIGVKFRWTIGSARNIVSRLVSQTFLIRGHRGRLGYNAEPVINQEFRDTKIGVHDFFLTAVERRNLKGMTEEEQAQWYAETEQLVQLDKRIQADAIGQAREATRPYWDAHRAKIGRKPKPRPKAEEPAKAKLVQLVLLFDPPAFVAASVVGESKANIGVQTRVAETVYEPKSGDSATVYTAKSGAVHGEKSRPIISGFNSSSSSNPPEPSASSTATSAADAHELALMMMAAKLPLSEDTAATLLENVRAVEPSATPREVLHLAHGMLANAGTARNRVGLLLARLHTHAKGATLEAARAAARQQIQRELDRCYDPAEMARLRAELDRTGRTARGGES